MEHRFKIGQTYTHVRPNSKQERTIVDILETYNSKGELVKIRYVTEHSFMGQKLTDYDVLETSIARALLNN
jgi:hypothetical protein